MITKVGATNYFRYFLGGKFNETANMPFKSYLEIGFLQLRGSGDLQWLFALPLFLVMRVFFVLAGFRHDSC
jgi:hypothetical protein